MNIGIANYFISNVYIVSNFFDFIYGTSGFRYINLFFIDIIYL